MAESGATERPESLRKHAPAAWQRTIGSQVNGEGLFQRRSAIGTGHVIHAHLERQPAGVGEVRFEGLYGHLGPDKGSLLRRRPRRRTIPVTIVLEAAPANASNAPVGQFMKGAGSIVSPIANERNTRRSGFVERFRSATNEPRTIAAAKPPIEAAGNLPIVQRTGARAHGHDQRASSQGQAANAS